MTFAATILTLYPEMFPGPLGMSLAGRALERGIWSCTMVSIRDFATDKHRSVDDTPAGGGAGMVLRADVLGRAVDHVMKRAAPLPNPSPKEEGLLGPRPIIALTPRGTPLTQARVRALAQGPGVILICGRFEGFDERIFAHDFAGQRIEEVCVGDVVLSGGEPAALLLLDACIRLLPGVMGTSHSASEESFEGGLLEYPHFTTPNLWEGQAIPEVLRSGYHARIAAWRKARAEADTKARRPDLWARYTRGDGAG